ncbi:MAG: prepilin-type N-terminal cleavage/methylation domain-containing protein [Acidimicrobiales bacterium]
MLTPRRLRVAERESGFTLLELMVTASILTVVLVVAGTALMALMRASQRGDVMVRDEQSASTTLASLARDIRSAHAIVMPPLVTPGNQLEMQLNQPGGGTTTIQWLYQPATLTQPSTLSRQVLNGTTVTSSAVELSNLTYPGSVRLFTYYNDQGADISLAQNSSIAACTTRVDVHLVISSAVPGVVPFAESEDVALTDQLAILSAPGNGQC